MKTTRRTFLLSSALTITSAVPAQARDGPIYRDLKERERRSGRKVVSYAESATEAGPNKAQPTGPAPAASDNISSR